jgi:predicted  nucleic acid-binding Zn-ribbon protein
MERSIETRLKTIEDAIGEIKDDQALLKLDIINLKNVIEQAKLGIFPELPKIEKEAKEAKKISKIEVQKTGPSATEIMGIVSDIGELQTGLEEVRNRLEQITIPKIPEIKDWSSEIKKLNRGLSKVTIAIERLKARKVRVPKLRISKIALQEKLKEITEKKISKAVKVDILNISKRIAKIEKDIKLMGKKLDSLQKQIKI